MLRRLFLTCKGEWKADPEFGFDYHYFYSSPDRAGVEQEVRRALSRCPAVTDVVTVSSALQPPNEHQKGYNLLISMQLTFDDGEQIDYVFENIRAEA